MRIGRGKFAKKKLSTTPKKQLERQSAALQPLCGSVTYLSTLLLRPAGCALHLAAPTAFLPLIGNTLFSPPFRLCLASCHSNCFFPLIESTRPYHPKEVRRGYSYLRFLSLTPLRFVEDRAFRQKPATCIFNYTALR